MDLNTALEALIADAPPADACIVGAWRARQNERLRENFDGAIANGGLTNAEIWKLLRDDVPFGLTSFRSHRQKECSCKN